MSPLLLRIVSAAVLFLIGFSCLLFDFRSRWIIISTILVPGAWELARLVDRKFASPHLAWFSAVSVLAFALPYYPGLVLPLLWNWGVAILTMTGYLLLGFRYVAIDVLAPWILMNAFVCGYLGFWGAKVFDLTRPELGWKGIGPLAYAILCVAAADTGAYAAGRLWGKRKLCPTISAKKTVEGAMGGVVATMLVSAFLAPKMTGLGLAPALFLGAVLAGSAILGDLFISVLKRYSGAKDTSQLIPGHGGIMDRFDALTFAAPMAWLGLKLLSSPLSPLHL